MAEKNNTEQIDKQIKEMKEWLDSQPYLPKDIDEIMILRFLHSCYYDIEKAKNAAELFFTIRASFNELFVNRDPQSPQMQKVFGIVNLAQITISENRNLWIWQLNDPGLEKYDYVQDAKVFVLSTDAWLLQNKNMEESDIVLMDVKDLTLKFLAKFNMSLAKKLSKYQEDAMPIRLKQIHVVNAPPFIDKLFGLMKPFLKQEITDMVHFHVPKSDTLYKYIDKEELPEEYGGNAGKMEDLNKKVLDIITLHREKLIGGNLWMASDKKSKNKKIKDRETSEVPSFRSLAID